jgi:tetratricopeptide (TPR) repeat protein
MRALSDGRFADAERLAQEALTAGRRALAPDAVFVFEIQMFVLRKELGQLQAIESDVARFVDAYPTRSLCRCVLANLHSELGRHDEARAIFEEYATSGFDELPVDDEWLLSTTLLSEVCTALVDVPRAATLYKLLLPQSTMVACLWNEVSLGSVSRYLGRLCSTLSRWQDAAAHFELALEINGRMGARSWLAHTYRDYAFALLQEDGPRAAERATNLLGQATMIDHELGVGVLPRGGDLLHKHCDARP